MTSSISTSRSKALGVAASVALAACLLSAQQAVAAVPGIRGPNFTLVASPGYSSQPDGASVYSWGYGCATGSGSLTPNLVPFAGSCPAMQLPGPTLIVTQGETVTVKLTNKLPAAAGNTSILFAGFQAGSLPTDPGVPGVLTKEAASGGTVTYQFVATTPGTHAYYSGTLPDLQIEMGLFGAIVVLPSASYAAPPSCKKGQYSLAVAAYDNDSTCYDREYLFQLSEMDSRIHDRALAAVNACPNAPCPPVVVRTEPYTPNYFLLNGRSMPDDMDSPYAPGYPSQPYNANPHMHPGEKLLMRVIGQGRWQHPFHFHGNHARVLARDGNLMLSKLDVGKPRAQQALAGPLLFTTPTVPGQSQDQIFTWTGKGLNWDVYNHLAKCAAGSAKNAGLRCVRDADCGGVAASCVDSATAGQACTPDASGYHSVATDPNHGEWCADHRKAIPATPPDPSIVANGQWYGGTPYLGLQSVDTGYTATPEAPGTLNQNPEAGYAYMWHSHNEREITTNDVFPGGIMSMLLIDPPSWFIDENR